jgi:hypothetical protein
MPRSWISMGVAASFFYERYKNSRQDIPRRVFLKRILLPSRLMGKE